MRKGVGVTVTVVHIGGCEHEIDDVEIHRNPKGHPMMVDGRWSGGLAGAVEFNARTGLGKGVATGWRLTEDARERLDLPKLVDPKPKAERKPRKPKLDPESAAARTLTLPLMMLDCAPDGDD